MRQPVSSLLALSCFAIAGCGDDPPTPTEVRASIAGDLAEVIRETNAAVTSSTEALPGDATLGIVDRVLGTSSSTSLRVHRFVDRFRHAGARPADGDAIDADEQIGYLNDKVFTDANHVGDGIYVIPPSLVCDDGEGAIDAECAQRLAQAQIRIRTAKEDGWVVFALQLDADHDEPLILRLKRNAIAVTVDLDDMQRAMIALASLFGEELPNVRLGGQVTGKLEILGTAKLRASVSIDRALVVRLADEGADLDGPDAIAFSSAKANVVSVTLDGPAKHGTAAIGLGETAVRIPARDVDDHRFELDLPGVTGEASFTAGQPVELKRLSLGQRTTTITVDGVRAQTIDLNPQDGRAFGATLSHDAASGADILEVSPKLDLRLFIDHAALHDDEAPVYDVTRVLLDGSLRGDGDQLEVLTGALSLETNPAGHGFAATAGQCIAATEVRDASGSYFTQWTVGACP